MNTAAISTRHVDPQGRKTAKALAPGLIREIAPCAAAEGADGLLALTEWKQPRGRDLARPTDLRNNYTLTKATATGIIACAGVGR